jgi:single-strand DNA-binding protein
MSGINKVILIGRLGAEPETAETKNGLGCKFSLATSESWTDKKTGQKQEKTEWHKIVIYGRLAEIAAQYLHKGSQVYLEGKLETVEYLDKANQKKWTTRVVLNAFNSKLEMLDNKNSQEQSNPVPPTTPPPVKEHTPIEPVAKDEFEDDIPF